MHVLTLLSRIVVVAGTAMACRWLSAEFGPFAAIGIWVAMVGCACALTAFLLARGAPGRITVVNHLAGALLPAGYSIGRGRLIPIVLVSSAVWIAVGVTAVLAIGGHGVGGSPRASSEPDAQVASTTVRVLLYVSWLIDGLVLARLATVLSRRRGSASAGLLRIVVGLGALVIASAVLAIGSTSAAKLGLALALAGGPPLIALLGYAIFFTLMMVFGRHLRWN